MAVPLFTTELFCTVTEPVDAGVCQTGSSQSCCPNRFLVRRSGQLGRSESYLADTGTANWGGRNNWGGRKADHGIPRDSEGAGSGNIPYTSRLTDWPAGMPPIGLPRIYVKKVFDEISPEIAEDCRAACGTPE
jgi:hypothetical protein